jgi:hypothetical protein
VNKTKTLFPAAGLLCLLLWFCRVVKKIAVYDESKIKNCPAACAISMRVSSLSGLQAAAALGLEPTAF